MAATGDRLESARIRAVAAVDDYAAELRRVEGARLGEGLIETRALKDRVEAVFAEGLRRFDQSGEYVADGAIDLVAWLRSKCKLSGGAAAERVGIARQLQHLPQTSKAFATGELGYAMGLRRDMPAFLAWTRGAGTPVGAQIAGAVLSILLILANSSRATNSLFSFIILLSTAAVLVVYTAGALSAWRLDRSRGARAIVIVALLFILFAVYGSGLEADLWCLALLAVGLAVREVMHRIPVRPAAAAAA